MGMQRIKHKAGVVLAATALLTGGSGFAAATTAQAAAAATCWGTNQTNNSSLVTTLKGTYNLKVGVGSVCGNVRSVSSGSTFYVWCGAINPDSGVLWFLGRVKGDSVANIGYMSSDNLKYVSGTWDYC
jgi:predicted MFS family arabinose efflux permease